MSETTTVTEWGKLAGEGMREDIGHRIDVAFYIPGDTDALSFRALVAADAALGVVRGRLAGEGEA